MRKVCLAYVDRADRSPLEPVRRALIDSGCAVNIEPVRNSSPAHVCDIFVLLGDKYQLLDAAKLATIHKVPIAHIHGGECTRGSWDNNVRDAISKLSHVHFVAADPYRAHLIKIGEDFNRIHLVGAPGLDRFKGFTQLDKQNKFVVTYHPETLGESSIKPLQDALRNFPDYEIVWTTPNNEPGHERNDTMVDLTDEEYILHVRTSLAVIGNSSSGIIEAPTLYTPTVNIGKRQDGRLRAESVFDCENDVDEILDAIYHAIDYDGPFVNPLGGPGASQKIANVVSTIDLDGILGKW